ncbi:MAG: tRNA (adenosine(37)-N6)-threonylcarbamoyltransferase complex ATPase subunit type 1 TsaE [Acidimicrobiales bacterium]
MSSVVLVSLRTHSPDHTGVIAARLAKVLAAGDLVVLTGDLGAGKTQFAKGIAVGLGVEDRVTSPTFALHQQYQGRRELLHHLDVYRLDDLAETLDLDLPELIESGVTVIEWGDTIEDVLPPERLVVRLVADGEVEDHREITIEAQSEVAARWRTRIAEVSW